jgi:hypothetical protein
LGNRKALPIAEERISRNSVAGNRTRNITTHQSTDNSNTKEHHYAVNHYFKDFNVPLVDYFFILSTVLSSTKLST